MRDEFRVQYRGSYVDFTLEVDNGIIHILDNDKEGTRSLTNAVDNVLLEAIFISLNSPSTDLHWEDFTYWLYGTDGIVSEYKNGFTYVEWNDRMPQDFLQTCKERRGQYLNVK